MRTEERDDGEGDDLTESRLVDGDGAEVRLWEPLSCRRRSTRPGSTTWPTSTAPRTRRVRGDRT
jgi:hypothetical protein